MKRSLIVIVLFSILFTLVAPVFAQRGRSAQQPSRFQQWRYFYRSYQWGFGGGGGPSVRTVFGAFCSETTEIGYVEQPATVEPNGVNLRDEISIEDYKNGAPYVLTSDLGVICLPLDYNPDLLTAISPSGETVNPPVYRNWQLSDEYQFSEDNPADFRDVEAKQTDVVMAVLPAYIFDELGVWTLRYGTDTPLELTVDISERAIPISVVGEVTGGTTFFLQNFPADTTIAVFGLTTSQFSVVESYAIDIDEDGTAYVSFPIPELDEADEVVGEDILVGFDMLNYMFIYRNETLVGLFEHLGGFEREVFQTADGLLKPEVVAADLMAEIGFSGSQNNAIGGGGDGSDGDCTYTVNYGDYVTRIASWFGMSYSDFLAANPNIRNYNIIYPGQVVNVRCVD